MALHLAHQFEVGNVNAANDGGRYGNNVFDTNDFVPETGDDIVVCIVVGVIVVKLGDINVGCGVAGGGIKLEVATR